MIIGTKILLSVFIKDKPSWVLKEEKRKALARERKIRKQIEINEMKRSNEIENENEKSRPAPPVGRPKNAIPKKQTGSKRRRRNYYQ